MRVIENSHFAKGTSSEALRKKCPYSELFGSVFFRIRTEYGEKQSIPPYSVRMQENGHFSCSEGITRFSQATHSVLEKFFAFFA